MKYTLNLMAAVLCAYVLIITGCGGSAKKVDNGGTNYVFVTGITLNKPSTSMLVGGNEPLTASVLPADASNKDIIWSSSAISIATVDSSGNVKGILDGNVTITAKTVEGSFTATCDVTVGTISYPVTGVSLTTTTSSIYVGGTVQLVAKIVPATATKQTVTWSSNLPGIATVSSSGLVTGVSQGDAIITVKTDDGNCTATHTATVLKSWVPVGLAGFSVSSVDNCNIALDSSDTIYVAYRDTSLKATVMKFNGSSWVTVGTAGFSAGSVDYLKLAIDPSGTPYVVYKDSANSDKATVMKFDGSNWSSVGPAGFSTALVKYTSIAIDKTGIPYVVYQDYSYGQATVMKFNGTGWVTVGAGGFSSGTADYTGIVITKTGTPTPYVVYEDDITYSFKATVMGLFGGIWSALGAAGFGAGQAWYTSIALGSSDIPFVVYQDWGNSKKASVMRLNGSWTTVGSAGFSAGTVYYPSIAVGSTSTPYVMYSDVGSSNKATVMKYTTATGWAPVGGAGFTAGAVSNTGIAIDSAGIPYVVFSGTNSKATVMKFQ